MKKIKLLGFIVLIGLASIGLGINAAILPTFRRNDKASAQIEVVQKDQNDQEEEVDEQKR